MHGDVKRNLITTLDYGFEADNLKSSFQLFKHIVLFTIQRAQFLWYILYSYKGGKFGSDNG